jgi:hypothetical protein
VSCRVAPFEFIYPALGFLFRVIQRLAELLPTLGALLGSGPCDSWICFAQWEKWSRVSENALAIKTCPTKMWSIQVKGAPKETWGRRQGR